MSTTTLGLYGSSCASERKTDDSVQGYGGRRWYWHGGYWYPRPYFYRAAYPYVYWPRYRLDDSFILTSSILAAQQTRSQAEQAQTQQQLLSELKQELSQQVNQQVDSKLLEFLLAEQMMQRQDQMQMMQPATGTTGFRRLF